MPYYQSKGAVPKKRHTVFKKRDGSLFYEELISREGFSHIYSNLYHLRMPTRVNKIGDFIPFTPKRSIGKHQARHIYTSNIKSSGDAISSRRLLLYNSDLNIIKAHSNLSMKFFYRNGHFDELIYVQKGSGVLESNFGNLVFHEGDYIIIPRGVIWKIKILTNCKFLIIESKGSIETPNKYRNRFGQLLEHSPYCERDIRVPQLEKPKDIKKDHLLILRLENGLQEMVYGHHPFDVVGWDGYFFPWIFNINDFEPIVGSLHQPPPVHQVFQSSGYVICSFVSRLFDFHPDAIPAPYPHSNVDSDEVIFYSKGDFMSRKGIKLESITYHPMGLPHGPQPGKYEDSIGKRKTDELAVMIDTFKPLKLASICDNYNDTNYPLSWIE